MAGTKQNPFDGSFIEFATSVWDSEIIGIDWSGADRDSIVFKRSVPVAAPTLPNYGNVVKKPGVNIDAGTVTVTVNYDPDDPPPIHADPEVITVTYAKEPGDSSAATEAFTGFVSHFDKGGSLGSGWEGTMVIEISDDVTTTAAASA